MTQCHWASRDLYTKDATEIQVSLISVPIIYNDFFLNKYPYFLII